jgi:lipoyl(octanoyl) transferase
MLDNLFIKSLQTREYQSVWQDMRAFTDQRIATTTDEIWFIEHLPVYTLGQAGKLEHILNSQNIPVLHVDRGGQVTYHGPGQLMVYVMLDLKRLGFGVRELVSRLEQSVIDLLALHQVVAQSKREAPGIYIGDAKICSIGLRIRKGCSYHGLALNVNMDLSPFAGINPCGFRGLQMTQMRDYGIELSLHEVAEQLQECLVRNLGYTDH